MQVPETPELDINIWHKRMGHLGEDNVKRLAKMVEGMKIKVRTTVGVCEPCLEGKQTRQPSHTSSRSLAPRCRAQPATRASEPLELIHSDLCGPIDPTTYGGTNYYVLFTDDFTRMTHIYPLKRKTSADVLEKFREYKPEVEKQTGKSIKRLRTDGGGEYEKWMGAHLKGSGIIHETTAPYSPDQNGVAERANRTIMERVKAIIAESKLDKRLWMEIADTIVYLKNRSPTSAVATTPYELWHGAKPNLSHLRIIGSTAYVHIPKEKRTKLDTHSHKGILVGYGGTNQYKVWDLTRNDVVVSRDVVFIEGKPVNQTPAVYEEPRTIHDSITVLPRPPESNSYRRNSDRERRFRFGRTRAGHGRPSDSIARIYGERTPRINKRVSKRVSKWVNKRVNKDVGKTDIQGNRCTTSSKTRTTKVAKSWRIWWRGIRWRAGR